MNNKRIAFTLAEVLIVLVIIGIIAAITIPAIMQSTQDMEFKTAYKKAFQVASNATNQAISDNAFVPKITAYEIDTSEGNFKTFESYFNVTKDCSNNNNSQCWESTGEKINTNYPTNNEFAFIDNSGMDWSMYFNKENILVVDTNGFKGPNQYGKDRWIFTFTNTNNSRIDIGLPNKIMPLFASGDITTTGSLWCPSPPCHYTSWLVN